MVGSGLGLVRGGSVYTVHTVYTVYTVYGARGQGSRIEGGVSIYGNHGLSRGPT